MMASNVSRAGAAALVVGLVAMGCSHAWDVLEPLPGSTATGTGGASTSSSGGLGGSGGAGVTTTSTSSVGGSSSVASSTSAVSSTSDVSSASAASSSASSGTGGGGSTAYYGATLAACNSDQDLDVTKCEALAGGKGIYLDSMSDLGLVERGFIRFDLDGTFAGKTIDAVTLRLRTLDGNAADSDHSGSIWQVGPFDSASLAMAQPATIGGAVAGDLGPVALSTDYYWAIPIGLVAPSAPLFLGIQTQSSDGARYWNDQGTTPPLLIVDYH